MIDHASKSLEPLLFVLDYFDGPIVGVAEFHGAPHYFEAEFDEVNDCYTNRYTLFELSEDTMKSVFAARAMWRRHMQVRREVPAEVGHEWKTLKSEMDENVSRDRALSRALKSTAQFVRVRHEGIDEDSFVVKWAPITSAL
jgi:hypothetical protein